MAEMGWGYGSECHLLRYLGRHRRRLDTQVKLLVDAETIEWCDFKFDRSKTWLDAELAGLSFLEADQPAKEALGQHLAAAGHPAHPGRRR